MSSKTIVLSAAVAAVLCGGIYAGGVYLTGYKIDQMLDNIDAAVRDNPSIKSMEIGGKAEYKRISDGFFTNVGILEVTYDKWHTSVPVLIHKGFLKAEADVDLTEALEPLYENVELKEGSAKGSMKINYSAISDELNVDTVITAEYDDEQLKSKNPKAVFNMKADSDEQITFKGNFDNLADGEDVFISKATSDANFIKVENNYIIKSASIRMYDFKFSESGKNAKEMDIDIASENMSKDGNMDIRLKMAGDNFVDFIYDYDIDLLLSKFNIQDLIASDPDKKNEILYPNFNTIKIEKFNLRTASALGMFIGTQEEKTVKSSGLITFDPKNISETAKGEVVINVDSNKGIEQYVKSVDGGYQMTVKYDGEDILVNGEKFN